MSINIIESDMTFGSYREDLCFYIEKSKTVEKINKKAQKGEGVKIAEFLLLETNKSVIYIIEAKTNPPPNNLETRLNDFIEDVKQKFSNTLPLFVSIYLNRHNENTNNFSELFRKLDLSKVTFLLVLVIKNSDTRQNQQLQEALHKALKQTIKIWNLSLSTSAIVVLNEQGAKQRKLILK